MSGYAEYRQLWVELGLLKPDPPEVPVWARYVCLDPNGDVLAFLSPPKYDGEAWTPDGKDTIYRLIWSHEDGPYPHALAALLCAPVARARLA